MLLLEVGLFSYFRPTDCCFKCLPFHPYVLRQRSFAIMVAADTPPSAAVDETLSTPVVPLDLEDAAPARTRLRVVAIIGALYVCLSTHSSQDIS